MSFELRIHRQPRAGRQRHAIGLLHRVPRPGVVQADQDAYTPGKAMLLFISAHEVWPGHFMQNLHANRSRYEFGRLFVDYEAYSRASL